MIFLWNFDNFAPIRLVTRGFSRSLITNIIIQNGGSSTRVSGETFDNFASLRNDYSKVFEVADCKSKVRILKFKMANPILGSSAPFPSAISNISLGFAWKLLPGVSEVGDYNYYYYYFSFFIQFYTFCKIFSIWSNIAVILDPFSVISKTPENFRANHRKKTQN